MKEVLAMSEKKYLLASEVAEMLGNGWSRQRVHVQRSRGTFPEPEKTVKMGKYESPLWSEDQVNSYMNKGAKTK